MKFYTYEEYAERNDLSLDEVKTQITHNKIQPVKIRHNDYRLIPVPEGQSFPYVVTLNNLKGGCAKTTTAVHLAVSLSNHFRVLLIDTDHQNHCQHFFAPRPFDYTLLNAMNGEASIRDCIYNVQTAKTTLDIIFSDYKLTLLSRNLDNNGLLSELLEDIKEHYEFIIIDTSPALDVITENALIACDKIIIPVEPVILSAEGFNENILALQAIGIDISKIAGVLFTLVSDKLASHRDMIGILKQMEGIDEMIFDTKIERDGQMEHALRARTNLFDFREKSKASQAYKKFTFEFLRRL